MDASHRKIELQSPSDLSYLTSLLRTAALAKLNLHLPSVSASEPDDLRRQVEDLVDAFVAQILAGMRANISINGMEMVPDGGDEAGDKGMEVEEYEVFDEKLRAKVGAMIAKRDGLVGRISEHRRGTAGLAAAKWREGWERESKELLAEQERGMEEVDGVADVEALQRREEVERNFEKAVEGLKRLEGGLPETRARLERAGTVVGYVAGEGK